MGVQVDVKQIIAALEYILAQRRRGQAVENDVLDVEVALERAGADRLQRGGQIEIGANVGAGFKRMLANGSEPLGQLQ